jgi:PAS domain-containing protein
VHYLDVDETQGRERPSPADDRLWVADRELGQLQAALDQLPSATVVADRRSGRIIFANREAERIYRGRLAESQAGDEQRVFLSDGQPCPHDEMPIIRALRTGQVTAGVEMELARPDGTRCPILVCAAPVRDPDGESLPPLPPSTTLPTRSARRRSTRNSCAGSGRRAWKWRPRTAA